MTVLRNLAVVAAVAGSALAAPASAQFYFQSHDMSGPPARGDEPGLPSLPGANEDEVRANLVWNLRSALNVAALQCKFEPSLLTLQNYNIVLENHKDELKRAYDTMNKYFIRTAKGIKPGLSAMDRYGTRTYSAFTTVGAQYGFCQTAATTLTHAVYAPRGTLYKVAVAEMSALRNALTPWGEERFLRRIRIDTRVALPRLDPICWSKRNEWVAKKCGAFELTYR
jgi:hypothetical protein